MGLMAYQQVAITSTFMEPLTLNGTAACGHCWVGDSYRVTSTVSILTPSIFMMMNLSAP